jgi:hypothetical protein
MARKARAPSRWFLLVAAVAVLGLGLASQVTAQVRFATGSIEGDWAEFDPINPPLTTIYTTTMGRQCGPGAGCPGQSYPGFAPNQEMLPVRPTGALLSGGTAQGDPVQMPYANEWALTTMGTVPAGVIPGVLLIMTWFEGRNNSALAATGKGWSAGGGPGNKIINPAAVAIPGAVITTRTFPSATAGSFGATVVSGNVVNRNFPTMPAQPNAILRMQTTAGPRQFGGSVELLSDTPNRLTLTFGVGPYVRTNGRCAPSTPFGDCHVGFYIGTTKVQTSVRIYKNGPALLQEYWRWYGMAWTTGTASAAARLPNQETSLGRTGTDVGGASRHLVMVTPVIAYGRGLTGANGATGQVWTWDMTFLPEPSAGVGIASALGVLGLLARRRGRA